MSDSVTRQFAAKMRNLFQTAKMTARNDDGSLKAETTYGRTIDDLNEAFPYGFKAKAESGELTVLCAGGSLDAVKILPVENSDDAPELETGDVAVYSSGGNRVICRKDGSIETLADDGNIIVTASKGSVSITAGGGKTIYIGNGSESVCSLLCSLADDILAKFQTFGPPPRHNVHPTTVAAVNQWKVKVQQTFADNSEESDA